MYQLLLRRHGASPRLQATAVALWLFSPFTATISARGNGEALVTLMLLGLLLALKAGEWGRGIAQARTAVALLCFGSQRC